MLGFGRFLELLGAMTRFHSPASVCKGELWDFKEHLVSLNSSYIPYGKLKWQWNMDPLKMYFLLNMGIVHCYISFPEGIQSYVGSTPSHHPRWHYILSMESQYIKPLFATVTGGRSKFYEYDFISYSIALLVNEHGKMNFLLLYTDVLLPACVGFPLPR